MFNRKYKKGMADAAKAYEAFGRKQEEALNHILEEVRQGKKDMESALKELNGNIDSLYDYLKSKEKAKLYTVYTPFDIKKLGEQEKLFLVGALYRLTMDKVPNENQQNYLRAIQKYLEIKDPPFGTDPMAVENIEDIPTQKAILQAVLEFLSLQGGDSYDETQLQQDFLDAFSVNARGRQEIMTHIELLYTATGAKGLAEKYGYVPEEEPEGNEDDELGAPTGSDFIALKEEFADKIMKENDYNVSMCIETEHYCFILPTELKSLDKRDGSMLNFQHLPTNRYEAVQCVEYLPDTIAVEFIDSNVHHIGLFDLSTEQYSEIDCGKDIVLLCSHNKYIIYGNADQRDIFIYDLQRKNIREVMKPKNASSYGGYNMAAGISNSSLYLITYSENDLYRVNLDDDLQPMYLQKITTDRTPRQLAIDGEDFLYVYSVGGIMGSRTRLIKVDLHTQHSQVIFRDDDGLNSMCRIHIYDDFVVYRTNSDGELMGVTVKTGELDRITASSECANTAMILAWQGCKLNNFPRIGEWIYFQKKGDSKIARVSIHAPSHISILKA